MQAEPPRENEAEARGISTPLARNIDALMRRRRQASARQSLTDKLAARVAAFTGSSWSVLAHAVVFGLWIAFNLGAVPAIEPWDPSLVVLAMAASVEAIFLTTFVLMNQNRLARMENERAELTLQISLLAEHEMTQIGALVTDIANKLGVSVSDPEVEELTQDIAPERILDEIERKQPD